MGVLEMSAVLGSVDTRKSRRQTRDDDMPVKTAKSEEISAYDDEVEEAEFDRQAIIALSSERGQETSRKVLEHFKIRKLYRVIKR